MSETATKTKTRTVAEFKRWARENRALASAVIHARAFALAERERVDAYTKPIFEAFGWKGTLGEFGVVVETEKDLFACVHTHEEKMAAYHKACCEANIAHGWTGNPEHCPALVADGEAGKAESRLIEAGLRFMGIEGPGLYGEWRKKMLDTLLGACIQAGAR